MEKKYRILWTVSLLVIICITVVIAGCSLISIDLPDIVTRILGIIDLLAIPILAFSSIKLKAMKKEDEEKRRTK